MSQQEFAWAIVNEYADHQVENPAFADADVVIAAPTIDVPLLRAKMKDGARLYAYMESIMIPSKTDDVAPFYLELQEAMHFAPPYDSFWCDSDANGLPVPHNFGDTNWPQSRIKPKNTYADWLVDFVVASEVLRKFEGIYWDDLTKDVPKYVYEKLPINWQDAATLQKLQTDHAHYINRVASGARARMPADYKFMGNTAKFTHPALDAITVEQKSTQNQGGATRAEAIDACKNQIAHGMNREKCVIWYGAGAPEAIEGRWPK